MKTIGSRIGPVAFFVHINKLPQAIKEVLNLRLPCERQNDDCIIIDDDTILFMDDSTTYEIINVHSHPRYKDRLHPRKD